MQFRSIGALSVAVSVFTALVANPPQARAIPTEPIDIAVKITFDPGATTAPWSLTGNAALYLALNSPSVATFNIGTLIPGNPVFSGHYQPTDPCVGGATCTVYFSFGGSTNEAGPGHPTYGFQTNNVPGSDPGFASELLVGIFSPGDPCFSGGVCHAGGLIVAYSTATPVGQWDVTISATPLPGALPLFTVGLGALGLFGWRRKKKTAALAA